VLLLPARLENCLPGIILTQKLRVKGLDPIVVGSSQLSGGFEETLLFQPTDEYEENFIISYKNFGQMGELLKTSTAI
jgi:hypothetical protein